MKNTPAKRTFIAMILGLSSIALCTAYAAEAVNTTKKAESTGTLISTKHDKVVQNFKNDKLDVQFRYIKGKLSSVKLLNTSKIPLQVNILHEDYLLGPNDYVVIDPPNIKHLIVHHYPVKIAKTTVGRMLPSRFGKHKIYNLPNKLHDSSTTKSVHSANENP